jgi:hypothetical protein
MLLAALLLRNMWCSWAESHVFLGGKMEAARRDVSLSSNILVSAWAAASVASCAIDIATAHSVVEEAYAAVCLIFDAWANKQHILAMMNTSMFWIFWGVCYTAAM